MDLRLFESPLFCSLQLVSMLVVVPTAFAKFGLDCISVVAPCFGSDIADPVSSLGISLLGYSGVIVRLSLLRKTILNPEY